MSRHARLRRAIVVAVVVVEIVGGASPAFAAPDVLAVYPLPTIIDNITKWVVGLLFGVGTLFFTVGAFRIMAAGGNPTEIEKGKLAIRSAVIGYAAAVLAPILLGIAKNLIGA